LLLLFGVHATCLCLLAICIEVGCFYTGINTFAFMAAEVGITTRPLLANKAETTAMANKRKMAARK